MGVSIFLGQVNGYKYESVLYLEISVQSILFILLTCEDIICMKF